MDWGLTSSAMPSKPAGPARVSGRISIYQAHTVYQRWSHVGLSIWFFNQNILYHILSDLKIYVHVSYLYHFDIGVELVCKSHVKIYGFINQVRLFFIHAMLVRGLNDLSKLLIRSPVFLRSDPFLLWVVFILSFDCNAIQTEQEFVWI